MVYINKDSLTDSYFPDTRTGSEYEALRPKIYDSMWTVVADNLQAGGSVLVDAPLVKELQSQQQRDEIRVLAERSGACLKVIRVYCSQNTLWERLQRRDSSRDAEKLADRPAFDGSHDPLFHIDWPHLDIEWEHVNIESVAIARRYLLTAAPADQSVRFEQVFKLWRAAHGRFDTRRIYEWKVLLGVWGSLVALIAATLSDGLRGDPWVALGMVLLGLAIVVLFGVWIAKLKGRNDTDRDEALCYWRELRALAAVELDPTLQERLSSAEDKRAEGILRDWNHRTQIAFMIVLWMVLTLVCWGVARRPGSTGTAPAGAISTGSSGEAVSVPGG